MVLKKIAFAGLVIILIVRGVCAQELPRANFDNTFYMLPIFESIRVPGGFTQAEKEEQILKMKEQLGEGNLYHRLGFSFIYSPASEQEVRNVFQLMEKHGIHAGLIFALQSHTRNDYRKIADEDFRLYQWRLDGEDWKGAYTSSGSLEIPEDERDYKIPTPSRYARSLRDFNGEKTSKWAESAMKLMEEFPGVVACINGPIEEELAIGGHSSNNKLADYSPYAITEFRDWLRHSGIYDDTDGEYAGEGASSLIIGDLINFNGVFRSQFYDDPTPDNSNGTGISFNQFFGTQFSTWSLKYWDLKIYPEPIVDEDFDCTPESGTGYTKSGFDAPRTLNPQDKFWKVWSYDIPDQSGQYPEGNPSSPAYGFRQVMVRNFSRDLFDILAECGLPREMMYAHQIPGEALGNFTGAGGRNRSSASTVWTGYLEKSKTVGITRFGDIDPTLMTQYAKDWGIFEWHTLPNPHLSVLSLYSTSLAHMNKFYEHQCHILFPGWWSVHSPASDAIFPLNDSDFGLAIHDFMSTRSEVPYTQGHDTINYLPPPVHGLTAKCNTEGKLEITWDANIWPDVPASWIEWDKFSHFEVNLSPDGSNWGTSDTTTATKIVFNFSDTIFQVKVRAHALSGLAGKWSYFNSTLCEGDSVNNFSLEAEYDSLYADPSVTNRIRFVTDQQVANINSEEIKVTITGAVSHRNTVPADRENIEMFWPMNSLSEVWGRHHLIDVKVSGGVFSGTVSGETPIDPYFYLTGSSLDGQKLNHISFRLYSSIAASGALYWFSNGQHYAHPFSLEKGWKIYSFASLSQWVNLTQIDAVRLDPGTTGSAEIMLDWFAISSKEVSRELGAEVSVLGNDVFINTSPSNSPGNYMVRVEYMTQVDSILIHTHLQNRKAEIKIHASNTDSLIELGNTMDFFAEASDSDGEIEKVLFLVNDLVWQVDDEYPYSFRFSPEEEGVYNIQAAAMDNAGETAYSQIISREVFMQENYQGSPFKVPGIIEAEDFDLGGTSVAYADKDSVNLGGVYREEAVDIGTILNGKGGYYVGWMKKGEWLEYTIELKESQKIDIAMLAASANGGGEIYFELDNIPISNHVFINQTGGDQVYDTISVKDIFMHRGIHQLKLFTVHGGFNLDRLELTATNPVLTHVPELSSQSSIYPNPANSVIHVQLPDGNCWDLEIWSADGRLQQKCRVSEQSVVINIEHLSRGIYLLKLASNKQACTLKFIKS